MLFGTVALRERPSDGVDKAMTLNRPEISRTTARSMSRALWRRELGPPSLSGDAEPPPPPPHKTCDVPESRFQSWWHNAARMMSIWRVSSKEFKRRGRTGMAAFGVATGQCTVEHRPAYSGAHHLYYPLGPRDKGMRCRVIVRCARTFLVCDLASCVQVACLV